MTDTEDRLRDYFQSRAGAVPDSDEGPGLDETPRSRHWPVLLSAAAIALVLGLTATVLTRLGPDDSQPAAPSGTASTAPGPLTDELPKIPYTTTKGTVTTLHDGAQTVVLPAGVDNYFSRRIDGGWLADRYTADGFSAGILQPNGTYRQLGPAGSDMPTASPDRTQVAVARYVPGKNQGQILVLDVRTGKEIAHTPIGSAPLVSGWNKYGIWFTSGEHDSPPKLPTLFVWRPGSGQPQKVSVPDFEGTRAMPPGTDNFVLGTRKGNERCLNAGTLQDNKFVVQRAYCDKGIKVQYPVLSPDGRTMLHTNANLAIDLQTGKTTKFKLPDPIQAWPEPVFEDATHLILLTERLVKSDIVQELFRCDVTTGTCKLVLKDGSNVKLSLP
jgi:hypothetical protein